MTPAMVSTARAQLQPVERVHGEQCVEASTGRLSPQLTASPRKLKSPEESISTSPQLVRTPHRRFTAPLPIRDTSAWRDAMQEAWRNPRPATAPCANASPGHAIGESASQASGIGAAPRAQSSGSSLLATKSYFGANAESDATAVDIQAASCSDNRACSSRISAYPGLDVQMAPALSEMHQAGGSSPTCSALDSQIDADRSMGEQLEAGLAETCGNVTCMPSTIAGHPWIGGASLIRVGDFWTPKPVSRNFLLAELATELRSLGEKRCEQQLLEDQILRDERRSQRAVETLRLKTSMCELKTLYIEVAAANAADSNRSTRSLMNAARDEYVTMLRRRLSQTESEMRKVREQKQRSETELQSLLPDGAASKRSQRSAAKELHAFFGGDLAASGCVESI